MPRHKQPPSHDILAGLRLRADPGTRWIARDGAVTTIRSKVVRFVTFEDAQDFANAHDITRNGVTRFVIENLTYTTTKEEVRQLFEPSGEVECINLITDCVMMEPSFKMYDRCHPTGNDKSLHADRA
jgi:RNA recognition motif-containing protein